MDPVIDDRNHVSFALKACLCCHIAADLKQLALRYCKLIVPAQIAQIKSASAMTQSFGEQLMIPSDGLALKQMLFGVPQGLNS